MLRVAVDDGGGGLAAGLAGAGALGGVGDGGEVDKDLACRGYGFGLDELVAELGEAADHLELALGFGGFGPGVELVDVDLAVLADVEDGEAAVGEEAEEEAELGGSKG